MSKNIASLHPDLLLFLGDYGNFGAIEKPDEFSSFLSSLPKPSLGTFAILGNHDYIPFVSVDKQGNYTISKKPQKAKIRKGFTRLFSPTYPSGTFSPTLNDVAITEGLLSLLEKNNIKILRNETVEIKEEGIRLQLTGVEEYMCGKMEIEKAMENYDPSLFSLLLMHNPDGVFHLGSFQPDIILSGHTHGAQINLPLLWKRFVLAEHPEYCRGKHLWKNSLFYILRGLGSALPFRLFSPPELLCLDLVQSKEKQS